jgi:hypothetical protein
LLGALLWWVRPRGEGHSQNVGSDSVIACQPSKYPTPNEIGEGSLMPHGFNGEIFTHCRSFILVGITFVAKLNKVLTIYLTLIHPSTKLPCFYSKTHLQNYASSLPTLQTLLQFGTSPKLV